jgi:hypothetical protein
MGDDEHEIQDPEDWILQSLDDRLARERERSHVEGDTLEHIRSLILEEELPPEPAIASARRLVPRMDDEQLAQVLADWLDAQTAI